MIVEQKALAMIHRHGLLLHGERILVAVSGGPDSVALLHVLHQLRVELRLELEVAHLQHGIRGEEAAEDARFVATLAENLQVPFHLKEINLPKMKLDAGKGNLEALARSERYRFFADVARERNIWKVATAHTQDDQAETVLMWFLRGAGSKGLGGMAPLHQMEVSTGGLADPLTVIRPLLDVSKAEILQFLNDSRLGYRVDRSNQDSTLLRNWLRLDLLPAIQRRFDDHVPARLGRQAEILRDEDTFLDGLALQRYAAMRQAGGLSRGAFLGEPKAMQRRILRLWIEQTRGHLRGLEFVHIDDILRLIEEGPSQGRSSIPGGWELLREYDSLKLEKPFSRRPDCYNYPLKIGVILRIPEANLEFRTERMPASPKALPDDLMEAVFDLDSLDESLSVRNFRHGDRFHPLGMTGHKKIKDLFIEKRVPLSIRTYCPLVVAGSEILWIPGYGRSAIATVSKKTTAVLHLKALPV